MASNPIIAPAANGKAVLQNGKAARLRNRANLWRGVHLGTGFLFAAWLILMAVTGVLINHQADWNLDEIEISNAILPGQYTTEYSPDSTRFNVIAADLHSGQFFWGMGKAITDLAALLVLLSISSGAYAFHLRRKVVRLCLDTCDIACMEIERERAKSESSSEAGAIQAQGPAQSADRGMKTDAREEDEVVKVG